MEDKPKCKPGPKPETLKIEMLLEEAAKRLVKAPEKRKSEERRGNQWAEWTSTL